MNRDELVKRLGQNKLIPFCISQESNFETPDHIRKISDLLEQVENGKIKRLIINMPPRHGKSYLATELFPAWYLGRNPTKNVISVSYNQDLANDFGRKVRNRIASDSYTPVFDEVALAQDSKSSSKFSLNQGGNYFAVGVGGPLTGRGADLMIMDDVIKNADEARSSTYQNKIIEWYQTTFRTRLMPDGAIILIMTRWTDRDLTNWIIENDKEQEWVHISLPAISNDNLALWPDRYPLDELERIKRELGTKNFNALYQQRPAPDEGNIIKREWIKHFETLPIQPDQVVISVDTTFSNNPTSDYCVLCVLARSRKSEDIYVLDVVRKKMGYVDAYNEIKKLSAKYPNSSILIEQSANGHSLIETLRPTTPNVIGIIPKGNKVSRIASIAPTFEAGQVHIISPKVNGQIEECIEELACFPDGKNDDFCDALSQGLLRLRSTARTKFFDQLIYDYDKVMSNIQNDSRPKDIREQMWPDHDWELEDSLTPMDNFYF